MLYKKLWGSLLILIIVLVLGACSKSGVQDETGNSDPDNGSEQPAPLTEPVELVWLNVNNQQEADFRRDFGDKITEKFPHVTLQLLTAGNSLETMSGYVTSGTQMDFIISSINLTSENVINMGLHYDISDLIKQYNYDLTQLEPSSVEIQRILAGGGIYGLPVNTTTIVLFYNKEIFDKFGISYPSDNLLWDEVYPIAQALTRESEGKQYYGFLISPLHYLLNNQLSLPLLDPQTNEVRFADDRFIQLMNQFIRFYQIPGAEKNRDLLTRNTARNNDLFFIDQSVGMYAILNSWRHEGMKTLDWDVAALPSFPEARGVGAQTYPNYVYISRTSNHKEQSFEILQYLTSDEFQLYQTRDLAKIPVSRNPEIMRSFAQGGDFAEYYQGKNIAALVPDTYADYTPKNEYTRLVEAPMATAMQQVARHQKDINTAVRELAEKAEADIRAVKER